MEPVEFRRRLHMHPELSFREHDTAAFISARLSELGIEHRPIAETGVLAKIEGRGKADPKRRAVVLRADIDALPVTERNDCEWRSQNEGVMHACGHDAHTAVGLGEARWLMDHKDELVGKVKLIFQPSEEGTRGSSPMTAAGVVDDVDWFFGGHIGTECHSHEVGVCHDVFLATVKFDVDFTGLESHAGAAPEKRSSPPRTPR